MTGRRGAGGQGSRGAGQDQTRRVSPFSHLVPKASETLRVFPKGAEPRIAGAQRRGQSVFRPQDENRKALLVSLAGAFPFGGDVAIGRDLQPTPSLVGSA